VRVAEAGLGHLAGDYRIAAALYRIAIFFGLLPIVPFIVQADPALPGILQRYLDRPDGGNARTTGQTAKLITPDGVMPALTRQGGSTLLGSGAAWC